MRASRSFRLVNEPVTTRHDSCGLARGQLGVIRPAQIPYRRGKRRELLSRGQEIERDTLDAVRSGYDGSQNEEGADGIDPSAPLLYLTRENES